MTGLVALLALLFLGLALNFLFNPLTAGAQFGVVPDGIVGLNTLRGDLGGLFLACSVMLLVGMVRAERLWYLAVAGIMAAIALGRLLGFVMDGFAGNNLPAFVAEIVFIAILATAYRQS